jgi:hypothetical protein
LKNLFTKIISLQAAAQGAKVQTSHQEKRSSSAKRNLMKLFFDCFKQKRNQAKEAKTRRRSRTNKRTNERSE